MVYLVEQPLRGAEAYAAFRPLVDAVRVWLCGPGAADSDAQSKAATELPRGGDFAAVFGGRGAGKSSILEGIRYKLAEPPSLAVLPPFCPEELPEEAELVSALVLHLEGAVCAGVAGGKRPAADDEQRPAWGEASAEIWRALAERRSPRDFQRVDEQLASSPANYRDRLVEGYKRHGALHRTLRAHIYAWIDEAAKRRQARSQNKPAHFVLLIDDIDLVHYRAWDLLDCLTHCFRHPQLSVVVFADEQMLIEGLTSGVRRADDKLSEARARELATAMSLKLLPARFYVPSLTEVERVERLDNLLEKAKLKADASGRKDPQPVEKQQEPSFWSLWLPKGDDAKGANLRADSLEIDLRAALGAVLPDNARQLKALCNRWTMREIKPIEITGDGRAQLRYGFAFEAISLQIPALPVRLLATRYIDDLRRGISGTGADGLGQPAEGVRARTNLLGQLVGQLGAADQADARRLLQALALLGSAVSAAEQKAELAKRKSVLHLALYEPRAGELDLVRSPAYGATSTIDLQLFRPEGGRAVPAARVPELVRNLDEALRAQAGLLALEKPSISLIAAAPLSLLVYLGWRLRRFPVRAFLNQHGGSWARYLGDLQGEGADRGAPLWRQEQVRQFAGADVDADELSLVLSTRSDVAGALDGLPDAAKLRCALGTVLISDVPAIPGAGPTLPEVPWSAPEHAVDRDSDAYADAMVLPRLVWQARDWIISQRQRHRTGTLHLLLAVPAPLAFYLGGHLHTLQPIQLYEYEGGRYLPTVRLDAGEGAPQAPDAWGSPAPEPAAAIVTRPEGDGLPAAEVVDGAENILRRRALDEE
jgi:hypothetical protein